MKLRRVPAVCALVSGGLDSGVLVHRLMKSGASVVPLYIRCGLRWETVELHWLRRFLRRIRSRRLLPLQTVELPLSSVYGLHWSLSGSSVPGAKSPDRAVYLPGRNVLLLSVAAIRCAEQRLSTIAVGLLKGNPFGDASPRFLSALAACLTQALEHSIRILAPLSGFSKMHLIRSEAAIPLALTFSCLAPRGVRHCGRCNKCAERRRAFRRAGVPDATSYV